eukprot:gene5009-15251_t
MAAAALPAEPTNWSDDMKKAFKVHRTMCQMVTDRGYLESNQREFRHWNEFQEEIGIQETDGTGPQMWIPDRDKMELYAML